MSNQENFVEVLTVDLGSNKSWITVLVSQPEQCFRIKATCSTEVIGCVLSYEGDGRDGYKTDIASQTLLPGLKIIENFKAGYVHVLQTLEFIQGPTSWLEESNWVDKFKRKFKELQSTTD